MKARRFYLSLFVFSGLIPVFHTIDPVTGAIAGAAGVAVASVSWKISSYFRESCDSGWIKFNEAGENVWFYVENAHLKRDELVSLLYMQRENETETVKKCIINLLFNYSLKSKNSLLQVHQVLWKIPFSLNLK